MAGRATPMRPRTERRRAQPLPLRLVLLITVAGTTPVAHATASPSGPSLARDAARLASRSAPLRIDPSLEQAAARHAREVLTDERAARLDRVDAALADEGLADFQTIPFTAVGSDVTALAALFRAFAEDTVVERGMTHVGVALVADPRRTRWALSAIFSRRLVELAPLPRDVRDPALSIRGRAPANVALEALLLGPCAPGGATCDGEVVSLRIVRSGRLVQTHVPLTRGPGLYTVELLATHDRGPEVAALWSFASGVPWPRHGLAPARVPESTSDAPGLAALVAAARETRELAPLEPDVALASAARGHAERVCARAIAAHVLPDDPSTPAERARRAGYEGRVAENVAIAPSVARAHANLLATPSHRKNVLDPAAKSVGVGVARSKPAASREPAFCVVELYGFE